MRMYAVLLLGLLPGLVWGNIDPATPGAQATAAPAGSPKVGSIAAQNAAIAAQAEAAVAAGQPAQWLVTFRAPEEQVVAQARLVSQSATVDMSAAQVDSIARQQVYGAVKTRVLGRAVHPSSASIVDEAGTATGQQQSGSSVQLISDYSHMPIVFVSISSPAELARLRSHPEVASVVPNGIVRPMVMQGINMIGQPAVQQRGLTGVGAVAVIDSGLDYKRAAFGPCTAPGTPAQTCKVVVAKDFAPADNMLDDPALQYHGTNVAGIILGVAPGVKVLGLDVFNGQDGAWDTLIQAINWVVANKAMYNITGINMSLGGGTSAGACDDFPLAAAVNTAYGAGIISAVAAGNDGDKTSLSYPACASKAVSVGAVYSESSSGLQAWQPCTDITTQEDRPTCFSNSNSQLTILAPGTDITAADVTHSGTSQATPFVSAALNILAARYPGYTLPQLVSVMTSTGIPVLDPANGITKPRLNLRSAAGISCVPTLSPEAVKAPKAGGSFTLTVTPSAPDCTWTVQQPAASWMRLVGATSGTGTGSVTLQVDPATSTARSTGVAASTTDGSRSALVSQAVVAPSADSIAPAMGRLRGSRTAAGASLMWSAARDQQSGVSSYVVVYNEGSVPPKPHCTTGTQIAAQPTSAGGTLSVSVAGLVSGSRYTFRVCAIDGAGNVSNGSIWRSTAI